MSEWPKEPRAWFTGSPLSTWSLYSLGGKLCGTSAPSSNAWPAANRAIFVPCRLNVHYSVTHLAIGAGATAGGNFDVGIYDRDGRKLVSTGAQARTVSVEHIIDVTDTLLPPGLYYLAMAADGTHNYIGRTLANAALGKLMGLREMASAYTLPTTATFATSTGLVVPSICAFGGTVE